MSLWTKAQACAATGGVCVVDWAASGVSIDTRTIQKGDLFVALKDQRDGHDFVAVALEKGAAGALVSHRPENVPENAPLLVVPDVLRALEDLGRAARERTEARVVAVTGSVGKTSTKEMLRCILQTQGKTHAAEASYNNHWGVPLTLARMPKETEFAVIEIGMSNPGEIEPLAKLARPHVAMITTIAPAHLEAFDDLNGIAREKASIFEGLEENGIALFNGDLESSDVIKDLAQGNKIESFGVKPANTHRLTSLHFAENATVCQAEIAGHTQLFKLSCFGRHFALNAVASIAAVNALGADQTLAARDISRWSPPQGRGQKNRVILDQTEDDALTLLDDAFNANPASMAAALEVLSVMGGENQPAKPPRRLAILGDMLELGPDEIALHQGISTLPYIEHIDKIHCVGPRMKALYEALDGDKRGVWYETAQDCARDVFRLLSAGDVVLVKGSKGSKLTLVVDAINKISQAQR